MTISPADAVPLGVVACSRCNLARVNSAVPCPNCGDVEYRINPEALIVTRKEGGK